MNKKLLLEILNRGYTIPFCCHTALTKLEMDMYSNEEIKKLFLFMRDGGLFFGNGTYYYVPSTKSERRKIRKWIHSL